ncbi:MAG: sensor histidine kinase [Thermoleophilaceae bacterium]
MSADTAVTAVLEPGAAARMSALLRAPFEARTWRATGYLLLSFPIGTAAFVILVTGLSLAFGLLITLIGIPILLGTLAVARGLAMVERRRAAVLEGAPIPDPYRPIPEGRIFGRLWAWLKQASTWKDVAWLFLLFPIGIFDLTLVVTVWGVALGMLTLPAWYWAVNGDPNTLDFGLFHANTLPKALIVAAVGLLATFIAPWIVRGWAHVELLMQQGVLGPGREELEQRVGELTATRAGAVEAQASELERIERNLHDGAQARLVALAMDLGMAEEKLDSDPEHAKQLVGEARSQAKQALTEMRDLVRGMQPHILRDRGLDAAIPALAGSTRLQTKVRVDVPRRLPAGVEAAAYYVVSESLANVAKHSGAQLASIDVALNGDWLVVQVADRGSGGADENGGGLTGLAKRVRALDGTFEVASPPGGGTRVRAVIPCAS